MPSQLTIQTSESRSSFSKSAGSHDVGHPLAVGRPLGIAQLAHAGEVAKRERPRGLRERGIGGNGADESGYGESGNPDTHDVGIPRSKDAGKASRTAIVAAPMLHP